MSQSEEGRGLGAFCGLTCATALASREFDVPAAGDDLSVEEECEILSIKRVESQFSPVKRVDGYEISPIKRV